MILYEHNSDSMFSKFYYLIINIWLLELIITEILIFIERVLFWFIYRVRIDYVVIISGSLNTKQLQGIIG